uniref:Clr5 domain-containing protein n=1 Tax=Caenorhabditis tropicalis TaxID=1561998 RepID=A0A1I7T2L9_9PELO
MKMNFDPYYLTQILYTNHETGTEYPTAIMLRLNERGFKHIKSTARQLFHKWQTTLESRSHPPQAFSDTILLVIDPEKFVSAETRQEARNLAWRDQSREVMDDIGLQLRNFTVYGWGDVPNIEAGDNVCEHLSGREFRRIFEEFGLQIDGDRFSYDPQASSSRNLTLKADEVPSEDSTDGEEDDDCSGNSEWGEIEMIETEVKRQIKRKREDENGLREDSESPPCSPTLKRRRNEELA